MSLEREALTNGPPPNYSSIESQPLHHQQKRQRVSKRIVATIIVLIISLLSFILWNVQYLNSHSQEYIEQSTQFEIKQVELESITSHGLNVRFIGLNTIDYDGVESSYFKNLFKLSGGAVQSVNIKLNSVDVSTALKDELISIGTVDIPPFKVNIANGKLTELDLIISIHPNTAKVLQLIKSVLKNPNNLLKFYGSSLLKLSIGVIPIGEFKLNFQQDYLTSDLLNLQTDQLTIDGLQIDEHDESYKFGLNLSLPNPLKKNDFLELDIPSLTWKILVEDCLQRHVIDIFDNGLTTDSFHISSSDELLRLNVSSDLSHLDPRLFKKCVDEEEEGFTPMTKLFDKFVNNESLPIVLKTIKDSGKSPSTIIDDLLSSIEFNLDYHSNFENSQIIQNVSLNNLEFELKNGDLNKPNINGEIVIFIRIPKGLTSLQIDKIKGIPNLYHDGVKFGHIELIDWHQCNDEIFNDVLKVSFQLNHEELQITNKQVFGRVINEIFNDGYSQIHIEAILDSSIQSLIGNFEIDQIHANCDSKITRRF